MGARNSLEGKARSGHDWARRRREWGFLLRCARSNAADTPLLGEASVRYCVTRAPFGSSATTGAKGWNVPFVVWLILLMEVGVGGLLAWIGWRMLRARNTQRAVAGG